MNNLLLSFKARTIAYLSASISKRFGAAVMLSSALVLSACGGGGGADAGAGGVVPGKSSVAVSQQSADNAPSSQAAQSSVRVSSTATNSSVASEASSKVSNSSVASALASSKSSQQVVTGSSVKSSMSASSIPVVASTSSSSKNSSSVVTISSASSTVTSTSAAATLASVEVAPGKVTLAVNATQQLVAVGKQANGSLVNLFGKVTWRISKGSEFATVSSTGLLKRTAAGEVEVEAASGGKTGLLKLATANPNMTIKYDNSTSKWAKVNIHYWTSTTNTTTWPGEAMTMVSDVNGIWTYEIDASKLSNGSINVIFNAGVGGPQTTNATAAVKQSSVFKDGVWTPIAGDSGTTKALVSVIDGTIKDGGTSFTSGTVLTINADTTSAAAFSGWTGASLAYIFTDPSKAEVKLVVPSDVSSVTLQALFAQVADPYKVARNLFATQCAGCHGVNGSGGLKALDGLHNSTYTMTTLIDKIATMQVLPTKCTGTTAGSCAYEIASMILANKWLPDEPNTAAEGLDNRNLRLLTKQEYLNSINDIFKEANVTFDATALSTVPAESTARNFTTASFLALDFDRTLGYQMAATEIAKKIVAAKGFLTLANNCGTATKCVTDLGKKIFRRPLTTAEVERYAGLYTSADAGKAVLQGLLISPNFLYRSEMGVLDQTSGLYRLTNYEIATLLSYSFWASAPDDALLAEAAKTTFDIRTQVARMLNDAKAERGLRRFAEGWFISNKYAYSAISSPTLAQAFSEETVRFVTETIKADLPFKTMLTANYTYANTELAQYYGSSAVGSGWAKSTFNSNDPRSGTGVLGHGSFLASRVIGGDNPSPIKRGTFVRDVLMCQELPPPQAAGLAIGGNPDDSNREASARHTSDPACQGCHQYIDGVGFGFESYGSDALFRTTETLKTGVVRQINALGEIKSLNSAETKLDPESVAEPYQTVPQLAALIANSGQAAACYSRQFYRYVTGRNEVTADEKIIPVYSANLREGGGMKQMLVDLTLNPNFVLRRK